MREGSPHPQCYGVRVICVIAATKAQADGLANDPGNFCRLAPGGGATGGLKWGAADQVTSDGCRGFFARESAAYCAGRAQATYELREFLFSELGVYQTNAGETKTCP